MENTPTMDVVLRRDTLVEATTELENVIDVERIDDTDVDEEYDAHRGIRVEYADGDVEYFEGYSIRRATLAQQLTDYNP